MTVSVVFLLCSMQLAFVASQVLQTLPTAILQTIKPGCVVNGHMYHVGESYSPSPCEHCYCTPRGTPACAIADCFGIAPCVDPVHDPTKCCPQCPNGENCRAHDGTIIKKGETYHPTPEESCQCPSNSFMFGAPLAICAVKMTMPPVHIDPIHVDPIQTVS